MTIENARALQEELVDEAVSALHWQKIAILRKRTGCFCKQISQHGCIRAQGRSDGLGALGWSASGQNCEVLQLMVQVKPDAVLILGDTNSCLSVIGAKRLHIPAFHMEADNRCKDECLPEKKNRRIADIISIVKTAGWAGGFDL